MNWTYWWCWRDLPRRAEEPLTSQDCGNGMLYKYYTLQGGVGVFYEHVTWPVAPLSRDQRCFVDIQTRGRGLKSQRVFYSLRLNWIGRQPFYSLLSHSSTSSCFLDPCSHEFSYKLSLTTPLFTLSLALAVRLTCSRTCRTNGDHREIVLFGNSGYYFVPAKEKSNAS